VRNWDPGGCDILASYPDEIPQDASSDALNEIRSNGYVFHGLSVANWFNDAEELGAKSRIRNDRYNKLVFSSYVHEQLNEGLHRNRERFLKFELDAQTFVAKGLL
jgi:hypothetical protein